jgi:hypothetical protein
MEGRISEREGSAHINKPFDIFDAIWPMMAGDQVK